MVDSRMMMETLGLSLRVSVKTWLALYLGGGLFWGILVKGSLVSHLVCVGLLLCLLSYYKLPPGDYGSSYRILGSDPRNFDGTPSKSKNDLGIVAHRCGGVEDIPENTLAALEDVKAKGLKCVEFDLSLSSDGEPFIFHDDKVDRLALNSKGLFKEKTSEEIRAIRITNKLFSPEDDDQSKHHSIPSLDEFVSLALKLQLKMILDIKSYESPMRVVQIVLNLFNKYPELYNSCMISSFFPHVVYLIRRKDPRIVVAMAWRPYFISSETYTGCLTDTRPRFESPVQNQLAILADVLLKWAFHNFLWHFLGLSAVLVHKGVITSEYVQLWRKRGLRVIAWTVNDSLEKIYFLKSLRVTPLSDTLESLTEEKLITSLTQDDD